MVRACGLSPTTASDCPIIEAKPRPYRRHLLGTWYLDRLYGSQLAFTFAFEENQEALSTMGHADMFAIWRLPVHSTAIRLSTTLTMQSSWAFLPLPQEGQCVQRTSNWFSRCDSRRRTILDSLLFRHSPSTSERQYLPQCMG